MSHNWIAAMGILILALIFLWERTQSVDVFMTDVLAKAGLSCFSNTTTKHIEIIIKIRETLLLKPHFHHFDTKNIW